MNPLTQTLLTLLQFAGYFVLFLLIVTVLVWAISKIIHEYFAAKVTFTQLTASEQQPDITTMFKAYMDAKNGTREPVGKEK